MTHFNKDDFDFDGMYLMYRGEQGEMTKYYEEPCHPTRLGKPRDAFIARFKYGNKPWKTWVNFLVKNFTVEEYLGLLEAGRTPVGAMRSKGFLEPAEKKELKLRGYPLTVAGWEQMIADKTSAYLAKMS